MNLKTRISKLEEAVPDEPWWREQMWSFPIAVQNEYIKYGTINGEKIDDGLDELDWTKEEIESYLQTGVEPEGKKQLR